MQGRRGFGAAWPRGQRARARRLAPAGTPPWTSYTSFTAALARVPRTRLVYRTCRHSPVGLHMRAVLSSLPLATSCPLAAAATPYTSAVCPTSSASTVPVESHTCGRRAMLLLRGYAYDVGECRQLPCAGACERTRHSNHAAPQALLLFALPALLPPFPPHPPAEPNSDQHDQQPACMPPVILTHLCPSPSRMAHAPPCTSCRGCPSQSRRLPARRCRAPCRCGPAVRSSSGTRLQGPRRALARVGRTAAAGDPRMTAGGCPQDAIGHTRWHALGMRLTRQ